jgi:AcrR family transcriptional regulator
VCVNLPRRIMQGSAVKRTMKDDSSASSLCPIGAVFSRKKGRPSNAMAGDVEERILDAASTVFLQQGFAGASLERIAEAAGAGKATLYSRYPSKEALFAEVVKRNCERCLRPVFEAPQSSSLSEQLEGVTRALVMRLLDDEVVGLIRVVIADAPRFPSLAKMTREAGRLRGIDAVASLMAEHSRHPRDAHAHAAVKRNALTIATQMLDAIVPPMLMRALMDENPDELRKEIRSHVKRTIEVFSAAGVLDTFL